MNNTQLIQAINSLSHALSCMNGELHSKNAKTVSDKIIELMEKLKV